MADPTRRPRWMAAPSRWDVRTRITLTAMVVVGVVLASAGAVVVAAQERQLQRNLDTTLAIRADDLVARVVASGGEPIGFGGGLGQDQLAQLVALEGEVTAASPGLEGADPVAPVPEGRQTVRTVGDLPIEDDSYRILSRRIDLDGRVVVLHLGENVDDLADSVRILTASLLLVIPIVVLVLGGIVWWLVGRTLRPVEAIRTEVAAIGAAQLDRRVPVPDSDDEIGRLASTMNAMLDRLQRAATPQQEFVADASHELRSPLTRIRTEVEVALTQHRGNDRGTFDRVLTSVLDDTGELQRLVDDLLHLARSDAGLRSGVRQPVDLDDLVFREAGRLKDGGHEIDLTNVSAAQVIGDPAQLTRVVRNLLDNATRHARQVVRVELSEVGGVARLVVIDDGPGVPIPERERIFERFTRLDDARTRDDGGAGLGLPIARDIVEAHGGELVLSVDDGVDGACFVVRMPLT